VYLADDIRRILDSLQLARPDLAEAFAMVRVAFGVGAVRVRERSEDYIDVEAKLMR
jgi:hypothetical protein